MKKLFIFCILILGSHAKAADPVESIDPIASTPQVIVVYRNKCPENQENAIQMVKGLIAYEKSIKSYSLFFSPRNLGGWILLAPLICISRLS